MYLNINSTFQPYNYAELVAPFVAYKQAYEAAEKQMTTLVQQTAVWKNIAEKDRSPKAYEMFNSYNDKLTQAADDLSNGLTATNRASLMDLQRGYASNITPIVNAYNRRAKLIDALAEAKLKNPYIETEYDPESMSLDDFIDNPNQTWGQALNGALVAQQVDAAAKNLAREAHTEEGQQKLRELLPYTYEMVKSTGFKSDDILRAIKQDPNAPKVLQQIVEDAVKGTGVYDWQGIKDSNGSYTKRGQDIINRLVNIGNNSLWSAIGQENSQIINDSFGSQAALMQLKQQYDMQTATAATAAAGNEEGYNPGLDISYDRMDLSGTDMQKARQKLNTDYSTLGYNPNSKHIAYHIEVPIVTSRTTYAPMSGGAMSNLTVLHPRIWGETGKFGTTGYLLSEKQFVSQGKTEEERQGLRNYYKEKIIPAYVNIVGKNNAWGSGLSHQANIYKASKDKNNLGNSFVTVPRMNFKDNASVLTDRVGSFINNGQLQEIEGSDVNGNISLKKSGISPSEWSDIKKDITDKEISAGDIQYHVLAGDSKGNNGVVLTITRNGKTKNYLIRDSYLTSRATQRFREINAQVEEQVARARKEGESEATIQHIKEQIYSANLSNLIRDLSWDVAGSYNVPTQNLQQSSSTSNQ